jgi:hypothetical protein
MFIRFRQTKTRLQVSLIETRRVGGKVRHEHVAMLGTVDAPPSVAGRFAFWLHLHERMAKLGNRLDAATQAKLFGDIHARIPMVTPDDVQAEQLANAKVEAQTWNVIANVHAGTVESHKGLVASAERAKAAAAEHAKAVEECERIKDRIARIERGEDVAGGLGKPLTVEDMLKAGWSKADLVHCKQVSEVREAFGRDTLVNAVREATERATRSEVRALHRLIPYVDDISDEGDVDDIPDEGGEN